MPKAMMLRLVVDDAGMLWPDVLAKATGRGSYLCMRKECLDKINDKRLNVLKKNWPVLQVPRWDDFREKLGGALKRLIQQQLHLMKARVSLGRDAVVQDLWKNEPRMLILSDQAGQALLRQMSTCVSKRDEAGLQTVALQDVPEEILIDVFGRSMISVLSMPDDGQVKKLKQYVVWYGRLKEV
jgi:predicted RNA-binding protein YlxR (DUF448 family)